MKAKVVGADSARGGWFFVAIGEDDRWEAGLEADAAGLYRFLQRRGVIAGEPGRVPDRPCQVTPLDGMDVVAKLETDAPDSAVTSASTVTSGGEATPGEADGGIFRSVFMVGGGVAVAFVLLFAMTFLVLRPR